ncbi:MAG TPA: twin-arginine translocase TatA/TatE family subunit [Pyrinomonadaceae bacterium]|jgi:sec-independent protein translocase protein TatA|nr:twin-arginine translocase TatA/TatE family subunit [Pyrinomonadaceae bacterium]
MNLSSTEILLIVLVIFLLFGASRLPQLAKALGQSKKAFREGMKEAEEEEKKEKQLEAQEKPKLTALSDQELLEELKRRSETQN